MLASRGLAARQLVLRAMSTSATSQPTTTARDDELYRFLHVKCVAHEATVLDSYEKFVRSSAEHLDIDHVATEAPWRTIKRKTMLACRFVKKKYRVQYEVRMYNRNMTFKNLTGSTADTFLEYIERNLPEGVLMIAEKHKLAQLPFDLTAQAQEEKHVQAEEEAAVKA